MKYKKQGLILYLHTTMLWKKIINIINNHIIQKSRKRPIKTIITSYHLCIVVIV